ncbi:hypothetical protein BHE74_00049905 [Ensete ventricosum]|nr:hypothetical protein BHE74_00049905 [Ensete ventricosum]
MPGIFRPIRVICKLVGWTGTYCPYQEEKKKRRRKNTSLAHRRRPRVARAHGHFFSRARRRSVSPRGEKDQGDIALEDLAAGRRNEAVPLLE